MVSYRRDTVGKVTVHGCGTMSATDQRADPRSASALPVPVRVKSGPRPSTGPLRDRRHGPVTAFTLLPFPTGFLHCKCYVLRSDTPRWDRVSVVQQESLDHPSSHARGLTRLVVCDRPGNVRHVHPHPPHGLEHLPAGEPLHGGRPGTTPFRPPTPPQDGPFEPMHQSVQLWARVIRPALRTVAGRW